MSVGYENTPIIQIISGITLLLGWFFGKANIAELDLYAIGQGNIWRLLFSQLIFENTAETVVGLMLLYIFRQFERQMGTRKFAFFVFLSMTISLFNVISFQILAQSVDILFIPASGPYFLIFSMLAIYYSRVPRLKNSGYQLFGLMLSEKSWVYLLALQMAVSGGFYTLIPAVSGIIVGYSYNLDYCSIQRYRFPKFIEFPFVVIGKLIVSLMPVSAPRTAVPTGRGGGQGTGAGAGAGQGSNADGFVPGGFRGDNNNSGAGGIMGGSAASPPSEEAIETLMGMGFDRPAVISALSRTNNNVESAANILLR